MLGIVAWDAEKKQIVNVGFDSAEGRTEGIVAFPTDFSVATTIRAIAPTEGLRSLSTRWSGSTRIQWCPRRWVKLTDSLRERRKPLRATLLQGNRRNESWPRGNASEEEGPIVARRGAYLPGGTRRSTLGGRRRGRIAGVGSGS